MKSSPLAAMSTCLSDSTSFRFLAVSSSTTWLSGLTGPSSLDFLVLPKSVKNFSTKKNFETALESKMQVAVSLTMVQLGDQSMCSAWVGWSVSIHRPLFLIALLRWVPVELRPTLSPWSFGPSYSYKLHVRAPLIWPCLDTDFAQA